MNSEDSILNPFNYHFFRIYIYHPCLFLLNLIRYPNKSFKLLKLNFSSNQYLLYGFKIISPKKIDKYFFANLNSKFNSFILELYEPNEKKLIDKYLNSKDVVLELGGCIGVISLNINKVIKHSKHLVLEIDPEKYNFLIKNRDLNDINFHTLNGVLSNKKKLYYEPSTNFWGGRLVNFKTNFSVRSYTIDQLEQNTNLVFNTLVMDIEGGEVEVFEEINLDNFNKLIFEIHFNRKSKNYTKIESKLVQSNFKKIESYGRVEYWKK